MDNRVSIAIDGPAGAGKSTVARLVAERLGYIYIDTGAMYRAVTLQALMDKININDETALTRVAVDVDIALRVNEKGHTRVYLNSLDVSKEIRSPEVSRHVSLVSRVPGVRKRMTQLQREMAARCSVVMEGRDIGTHVLPDADMKFFLTASVEERARRRHAELQERGYTLSFAEIVEDIKQRDNIDASRAVAPLKPAPDAEIIDCSIMTVEQVVNLIVTRVSGRFN
ncbi:(d)CMP kinase [Desulfoscipio geothermicus]|uniref:Cytidylate kinase n=1 Tax=Desulfoscipio geothermicus DSM 3669 TaxID=1121426 RepID=A0A1I6CU57_9FIRM|nr:(d)CMP kinase [Desulfoscipio geothermicus]SFQ96623.1 cytidylate kinase [Desulfoscipio geothermicus DSM 3669]